MNTSPNGYVLYVLHHLAVKVGDVARATQMVGMVVELQVLVGVALLEVAVKRVGLRHRLGLCRLQGAVVAAEALAVHIVVVVRSVVWHAKGSVIILYGLQLLTIFNIIVNRYRVGLVAGPFQTAFKNKAMKQLEGMIGTLRVYTSRLATKESYWIFHKDGDDFDLKVSDPKHPSYLLIANDPEMESIIGALNALILNRLVTRVNTGQGKNVPVSIIVDELPTLYFHKIDRLIGTARSNKVSVALGFQELPQLEADYGKVGMQKIITTVGNVVSGSARSKETLEWLSSDIFGKVVQLKKGVTIDRDKTSINLNENMDSLVPTSKISDMATGWICGQTARDFVATKTGRGGAMKIQESEEFKTTKFFCKTDFDMAEIKKYEAVYVPLPKFYTFKSKEERERILYKNFVQVGQEVKEMIEDVVNKKNAK